MTPNQIAACKIVIEDLCQERGNLLFEVSNMPVCAFTKKDGENGQRLANYEKKRLLNGLTLPLCQMFFMVEVDFGEHSKTTNARLREFLLNHLAQPVPEKWWG